MYGVVTRSALAWAGRLPGAPWTPDSTMLPSPFSPSPSSSSPSAKAASSSPCPAGGCRVSECRPKRGYVEVDGWSWDWRPRRPRSSLSRMKRPKSTQCFQRLHRSDLAEQQPLPRALRARLTVTLSTCARRPSASRSVHSLALSCTTFLQSLNGSPTHVFLASERAAARRGQVRKRSSDKASERRSRSVAGRKGAYGSSSP